MLIAYLMAFLDQMGSMTEKSACDDDNKRKNDCRSTFKISDYDDGSCSSSENEKSFFASIDLSKVRRDVVESPAETVAAGAFSKPADKIWKKGRPLKLATFSVRYFPPLQ